MVIDSSSLPEPGLTEPAMTLLSKAGHHTIKGAVAIGKLVHRRRSSGIKPKYEIRLL